MIVVFFFSRFSLYEFFWVGGGLGVLVGWASVWGLCRFGEVFRV